MGLGRRAGRWAAVERFPGAQAQAIPPARSAVGRAWAVVTCVVCLGLFCTDTSCYVFDAGCDVRGSWTRASPACAGAHRDAARPSVPRPGGEGGVRLRPGGFVVGRDARPARPGTQEQGERADRQTGRHTPSAAAVVVVVAPPTPGQGRREAFWGGVGGTAGYLGVLAVGCVGCTGRRVGTAMQVP